MIRRESTQPDLGLDSLTDTMTNMMGLILLMVVTSVAMSGGMRLVLLGELTDPGGRKPLHLVCKDGQVLYMHQGDEWTRALERVCAGLASRLGHKPTTSEAILEANRTGLCGTPDFRASFVREVAKEAGREVHVIGIRFFPRTAAPVGEHGAWLSTAAAQALAKAGAGTHYVDAFVYQSGADALKRLQALAKKRKLRLGWRPVLTHQVPGLSDYGVPGSVGARE